VSGCVSLQHSTAATAGDVRGGIAWGGASVRERADVPGCVAVAVSNCRLHAPAGAADVPLAAARLRPQGSLEDAAPEPDGRRNRPRQMQSPARRKKLYSATSADRRRGGEQGRNWEVD